MGATVSTAPSQDVLGDAIDAFFRRRSADPGAVRSVRWERITGGYSRLMLRVWVQDADGERGYIVRADPPPGESIVDSDRTEEWALLCALRDAGSIPMPAALWFDETGSELGSPAIVSELIDGPSLLSVAARSDASDHLVMAEPMCELAATIHRFDVAALPVHVARPASWDTYIGGRIRLWADAERALHDAEPFIRTIARWLVANKPEPVPLGLVHGDFQPANIVVDGDGRYHAIDWELAHVGDPREDLGWLTLCGTNQPPSLIAADPEGFYARYAELSGLPATAVDRGAIAYFTVLGATDVFLRVVDRLSLLISGNEASAMLAYMADAVAAMESVFMKAVSDHAAAKGTRA